MIKVLIVEDHRFTREVLKESLMSRNSLVALEEAANGREAMDKVESFQPDLIFMDIRLPDESGLKLTEKIKEKYPDTTVIILSSYDLSEYREFARQHGVAHFLRKDLTTSKEILSLVESLSMHYNQ
jgi:YesN/AraC family two-component response regulator